ncbi:PREDICTED: uncharacterized protein LOC109114896 [Nelumbo nucifera]|uniref:Uncharacterized protein LOC109114896 n=1 Tax=Nelumbo nucifera TaxID=4432 RepID=A0A1U8Q702_NELNU|nr:PREDICTED: uncharacterized protein LOC109114896 [Nelumbo nucifera]
MVVAIKKLDFESMQGYEEWQVSPMVPIDDDDLGPPWLKPMLKASYFIPCLIHGDSNQSECNLYCLDCMGNAISMHALIASSTKKTVALFGFFRYNNWKKSIIHLDSQALHSSLTAQKTTDPEELFKLSLQVALIVFLKFASLPTKLIPKVNGDPLLVVTLRDCLTQFEDSISSMHPGDRRLLQETVLWIRLVIHTLFIVV